MTDITAHPTTQDRASCCDALDAKSQRSGGGSVDQRATTAVVNSALGLALEQRGAGGLIRTDHGPQLRLGSFSLGTSTNSGLIQSIGSVG